MQHILQRIFEDTNFPQNGTQEELHNFFEKTVTAFEEGSDGKPGFLKQTALDPVNGDTELKDKLHEHRDELVLIKFWKRNCIPCLSVAEMYKEAEKRCIQEKLPVKFYSINTKEKQNSDVVDFQLVDGTPTIQRFHDYMQVGDDLRVMNLDDLMDTIYQDVEGIAKRK